MTPASSRHRSHRISRQSHGAAPIEGTSLRADDPPLPIVTCVLAMVWGEGTDNAPAERWLRSRIIDDMGVPD